MRIMSIELAGISNATLHDGAPGLPSAFARITRNPGEDCIAVELLLASGERTHRVQADSDDDIWSMADCLQSQLDGCKGTRGDIHGYYTILQYFAD